MDPHPLQLLHHSIMDVYGTHIVYSLSICMVIILVLIFRHVRARKTVVDPENTNWPSTSIDHVYAEKAELDLSYSSMLKVQTQEFELFSPLIDSTTTESRPFTSGFLAARADLERAGKGTTGNDISALNLPSIREVDFSPQLRAPFDPRRECLRRCSYPLPQKPERSLFRDDADVDRTDRLSDGSDPVVFWRRRTMVFEGKP